MKQNFASIFCFLLFLLPISACDKDSSDTPIIPDKPDSPAPTELKQESLYGNWILSRDDNGLFLKTVIALNQDNTCVYTQTIKSGENEAETEELNKATLSGRWSVDTKTAILTFDLSDEGGSTLSLTAAAEFSNLGIAESFKILDAYSAEDDFCFKK